MFTARLSKALYLCSLLLDLFLTTKRHPFDLVQVIQTVGLNFALCVKSFITQGIFIIRFDPNLKQRFTFGSPIIVPNFSWIEVHICESQQFLLNVQKEK